MALKILDRRFISVIGKGGTGKTTVSAALAILAARGEALLDRPEAFVFGAVAWAVYFLNVRYNKADRKMQENYQDQIFWLQMHDDLVVDLLKKRIAPDKG